MTGSGSGAERVEHVEKPLQGRDRQSAPTPTFAFIYLASQSPRRRQLLDQIGVRHELLLAGPDGLDPALQAGADERWRLSDLTLPHGLVRVLLAEALYRAWTVTTHHPYHRE